MSKNYNKGGGFVPSPKNITPARNTTVAIVGTHPITREMAPFHDKTVDIWVFNGQAVMDWCTRATAVFDMHAPGDIYRRAEEDPRFGQWLKSEKGMPYYTPFALPEYPDNVIYPIEEVSKNLLKNFVRGDEINKYFTSGPTYAIALAIHLGYKRIEMYGVEMENNTEYLYQRDGVGLWQGIAVGKGVTVVNSIQSMMFRAPLYGYEMDADKIDRETFEAKASELEMLMEKTHSEYNRARGILDAIQKEFIDAQLNKIPQDELVKIGEKYEEAQNRYEQSIANHAFVNGQYIDCRTWQSRVEKVMEYNGKAALVLAQNDEKWGRMADKLELTGRQLPNE